MTEALMFLVVAMAFLLMFAGFSALMGVAAAWVLSFFGLTVPWYVCSVAIFILGTVFKGTVHVSK